MKLRKLTIAFVMICLVSMIGIVAFAEYYFERIVQDADVTLGNVSLGDYSFKSYAGVDENGYYTTERLDEAVDATVSASGRITCYASEKTGFIGENEYISLNQLGFEFSYTNTLDVYVRVQVQDAWISRKYYSGSSDAKDNYIKRDNTNRYIQASNVTADNVTNFFTITATKATTYDSSKTYYMLDGTTYIEASVGSSTSFTDNTYYTLAITKATTYSSTAKYYYNANSPFSVQNENWVYDNATGCIYYKLVSDASDSEKTISFDIDENYVYVSNNNAIGYREAILVEVGFNIDIVQANRAHAVWGIDIDSYFD